MGKVTRLQGSDEPTDLIRDVHFSWNDLREEIDRRLRMALDEELALPARRRAAAWLASICETARGRKDDGAT